MSGKVDVESGGGVGDVRSVKGVSSLSARFDAPSAGRVGAIWVTEILLSRASCSSSSVKALNSLSSSSSRRPFFPFSAPFFDLDLLANEGVAELPGSSFCLLLLRGDISGWSHSAGIACHTSPAPLARWLARVLRGAVPKFDATDAGVAALRRDPDPDGREGVA